MNAIEAISQISADPTAAITHMAPIAADTAPAAGAKSTSFADLLGQGVANVENKIDVADQLVRDFALDDGVPIHQVTIAIEEARMAVDLALQVRTRLVEAYREIMNTQL